MAQPGQKISKRARHRAAVEARKDQPVVKRRKQRRNPLPFPTGFFAMARENEREGVLMTRVQRQPARFFLEHFDASGVKIQGALQQLPKGTRGYDLMLEGGGVHSFKTQRRALKFFARLQKLEVTDENLHTDEQDSGVSDEDTQCAEDPGASEGGAS